MRTLLKRYAAEGTEYGAHKTDTVPTFEFPINIKLPHSICYQPNEEYPCNGISNFIGAGSYNLAYVAKDVKRVFKFPINPDSENLMDTPERLAAVWNEIYSDLIEDDSEMKTEIIRDNI